jgi:hypothetical protein
LALGVHVSIAYSKILAFLNIILVRRYRFEKDTYRHSKTKKGHGDGRAFKKLRDLWDAALAVHSAPHNQLPVSSIARYSRAHLSQS